MKTFLTNKADKNNMKMLQERVSKLEQIIDEIFNINSQAPQNFVKLNKLGTEEKSSK